MHLADAFIQSDLQCIQAIHFLSVCILNPQTFALLTQCSTTEPHWNIYIFFRCMDLYISELLCVCCLSHTLTQAVQASSGMTSKHYHSPFKLNGNKSRIILTWNDVFTCNFARGCDVSACAAVNTVKESARNRQDERKIVRFRSLAVQSVHL